MAHENGQSLTETGIGGPAPANRVNFIVREIGQRIVGGDFAPGNTLPVEQDLCETFKVGRNAVREAIKVLAGKGFVRTVRRAGTIVQPRRLWAMLDPDVLSWMLANPALRHDLLENLAELRRIIEPEAAALAARHATTTETLRLFETFELMGKHRHNRALAIDHDIHFHDLLLEASHNPLLISMARSIDVLLRANFEISIESPDGFIRNLDQHGKVADAIHRRDADAARREMLILLANNEADLDEMLDPGRLALVGDDARAENRSVQSTESAR